MLMSMKMNMNANKVLLASFASLVKQAGGTFIECDIATVTIYTGSDINKILKAEAKISAEYLALNP